MKMNLLDHSLSFDEPITDEPIEFPTTQKRKFIRKELHIDNKTVKRDRVELTPSVCEVCALDIAEFNGLSNWNRVPEDRRSSIISAVKEHKKVAHPVKEDLIIDEDEIPSSWLGNNTVL